MTEIKYLCPYWGCEDKTAKEFLEAVIADGYDGVEINFPDDYLFVSEFMEELRRIRSNVNNGFIFIAQQYLEPATETVDEYIMRITKKLEFLVSLKPDYINSHTGKDYYDFEDNCRILTITDQISKSSNIPIWHEIHRGRFSFHAKTLLKYLQLFPKLNLIADFSHFCVVSESLLEDQQDTLDKIYPNIQHIHARIGYKQSPQVNNPFAPEWKNNLDIYVSWWRKIIKTKEKIKQPFFTITPEFGPAPYMPMEPFTLKPLANQWEINVQIKNYLKLNL